MRGLFTHIAVTCDHLQERFGFAVLVAVLGVALALCFSTLAYLLTHVCTHIMTYTAQVSETALSTRDWHHVLQRFGVARALVDDVASAAAVKWLPSPHLVQRRGISQEGEGMGEEGWGRQDKQLIHECDQISSANGLYELDPLSTII